MDGNFGTEDRHVNIHECLFIEFVFLIPKPTCLNVFEDLPPTTRPLLDKLRPVALNFLIVYGTPVLITCIGSDQSDVLVECDMDRVKFGRFRPSIGLDKPWNISFVSAMIS